jgi:hypothetical protein
MWYNNPSPTVGCNIPGKAPFLASAKLYAACGCFLKCVKAQLSSLVPSLEDSLGRITSHIKYHKKMTRRLVIRVILKLETGCR